MSLVVEVHRSFELSAGSTAMTFGSEDLPAAVASISLAGVAGARVAIGRVSVALEDMLVVPDWVEARSETARRIREIQSERNSVEPCVDIAFCRTLTLRFSDPLPRDTRAVVRGFELQDYS